MEEQMELFEDGGLKDEGGMVDEESGNDVPNGSTKKEVRDDIPAMLSEGEFVLPADVVRYHGLEKIMQLRDEAKFGLKKMEAMGQMGNSEEATLDDDVPFGPADLIIVGAEPMEDTDETKEMAQGGVVQAQAGTFVPSTGIAGTQPSVFNQNQQGQQNQQTSQYPFGLPASSFQPTQVSMNTGNAGGYGPKFLGGDQTRTAFRVPDREDFMPDVTDVYTTEEYINPETQERRTFSFYQGDPVTPIPEGFITVKAYEEQQAQGGDDLESTQPTTAMVRDDGDDNAARQRLANMVAEKQKESNVAIKDMKNDVLLELSE